MKVKSAPRWSKNARKLLPNFDGYSLEIFRKIEGYEQSWDTLLNHQNVFLSSTYLKVLEDAGPDNLAYIYCILYDDDIPAGLVYCQLTDFNAAKSLNLTGRSGQSAALKNPRQVLLKTISGQVRFRAIICGNALVTGEHAYRFLISLTKREEAALLSSILELVRTHLVEEGDPAPVILVKDFYEPRFLRDKGCFLGPSYHELSVQPNMVLDLPETWRTTADYLESMRSKYRVRTKRARKFARELQRRELDMADLERYTDRMFFLYNEIAQGADFNLFTLSKNYLSTFKCLLPEVFRVFGYFRNGEMLGFYSTVRNGREIEAHFLGYRQEVNRDYQLYHNMLVDIVEQAILTEAKRIIFARTALEIKSSIGAVPEQMHCYIHHSSGLKNALFPVIFHILNPDYNWEQRHPFSGDAVSDEEGERRELLG